MARSSPAKRAPSPNAWASSAGIRGSEGRAEAARARQSPCRPRKASGGGGEPERSERSAKDEQIAPPIERNLKVARSQGVIEPIEPRVEGFVTEMLEP